MPLSTYKRVWLHFWELKTFNITLFNNCSLWAYINCVVIDSTVFSKLCFNRLNVCFKNVLLKNSHYEPWKVQFIALMAQSIPSVIFPSGHSSSPVFPQWGNSLPGSRTFVITDFHIFCNFLKGKLFCKLYLKVNLWNVPNSILWDIVDIFLTLVVRFSKNLLAPLWGFCSFLRKRWEMPRGGAMTTLGIGWSITINV